MNHLFLHCRPGFEKECAAEIGDLASEAGVYGYAKTRDQAAHVIFVTQDDDGAQQLLERLRFQQLIFTRQWFAAGPLLQNLSPEDRLTPLLEAVKALPKAREWLIEAVDTNEGKALSGLGKKFSTPFGLALERGKHSDNKYLDKNSPWRLHLVFMTGTDAWVGISRINNSAAWPMGIPRLRLPRSAPSRATLKLEEAWHHFIPAEEWDQRLAGSMRAVDLGAAPGGWTWQLVQRGMFVEAVDNGPMDKDLMETGQVRHMRQDGFLFEPKKPVDWLVCDIVDKPARVAGMIIKWVASGYCREVVFNLKLPMKQRYMEVKKLEYRIMDTLGDQGIQVEVRFKQLYHDREEVTGHLRVSKPRQ